MGAYEKHLNCATMTGAAAADYTAQAAHSCVKDDSTAGAMVVCTAKTDRAVGYLINEPNTGEGLRYQPFVPGDIVLLVASAAIATQTEVTCTAGGKIVTSDATAGNQIIGVTVEACGADLDLVPVRIAPAVQE